MHSHNPIEGEPCASSLYPLSSLSFSQRWAEAMSQRSMRRVGSRSIGSRLTRMEREVLLRHTSRESGDPYLDQMNVAVVDNLMREAS